MQIQESDENEFTSILRCWDDSAILKISFVWFPDDLGNICFVYFKMQKISNWNLDHNFQFSDSFY